MCDAVIDKLESLQLEQKNEQILNILLIDFDHCQSKEGEDIEDTYPSMKIWRAVSKSSEPWEIFLKHDFDESKLKEELEKLDTEQARSLFSFGIGCMLSFVQANFTGPELDQDLAEYLEKPCFKKYNFPQMLFISNDEININTIYPCLLVAAKIIFQYCQLNPMLNAWWSWRAIMIHQLVLDELSPQLLNIADKMQSSIQKLDLGGHYRAKFEIEQAQLYLIYRNFSKAEVHLDKACEILGLKYEQVGKMGRRTKHQQQDIPQMALRIKLESRNFERTPVPKLKVPVDVQLNDDTRLHQVQYADREDVPQLTNIEQKLIIALIHKLIISRPRDDFYYQEIKLFIDAVLSQNNTWAVRAALLVLRSKLESKHKRTVERSVMQLEDILKSIRDTDPHPLTRAGGVYGTALQPIWRTETLYGDCLVTLGLIKSALDAYLRIQQWEEVIYCYNALDMRNKAAEIIKLELEKKESPKLWCLLGDASDDLSCYERAWFMSKKRSHRAQRHWGMYYYKRKMYQEAIPHFERSVSINPLQEKVWIRLGYAALQVENLQVAATAYRRYNTLEPDSYDAWNNLAQVYLKLGNKRSAHHSLTEAIRCNFDNWKVWENLLVVSSDINNFKDVLRCYHRLIEMQGKYLNTEVLGALVYGVCKDLNDHEGKASGHFMQKTRELLGRVTALYSSNGYLWELYADLSPMLYLRAQRLLRAYKCYVNQANWEKTAQGCQQVLYVLRNLAEITLKKDIDAKDTLVHSVRLAMSTTLNKVNKMNYSELKSLVEEVTGLLAEVTDKSKKGSLTKTEPPKAATESSANQQTTTST